MEQVWGSFSANDTSMKALPVNISFDDQLGRDFNFGLSDNMTSILLSISTSMTLLLLKDVFYRVVVRDEFQKISIYTIQRVSILNRSSIPLYWDSFLPHFKTPSYGETRDKTSEPPKLGAQISSITGITGVVLVTALLTFIFLSTSRMQNIDIDRFNMPSFQLRSSVPNFITPHILQRNRRIPFVVKNGYISHGTTEVFITGFHAPYVRGTTSHMTREKAKLRLTVRGRPGLLRIISHNGLMISRTDFAVELVVHDYGSYITDHHVQQNRALEMVSLAIKKRRMKPRIVHVMHNRTNIPLPNWSFSIDIVLGDVKVPRNLISLVSKDRGDIYKGWMFEQHAKNVYISSIATSILKVSLGSKAFLDNFSGEDLDEYNGPLISKQGPWLSLVFSVSITAGIAMISLILCWVFEFNSDIDFLRLWKEFEGEIINKIVES